MVEGYDELKQGHSETLLVHPSLMEGQKLKPHVVYELEDAELISSGNLKSFSDYLRSTKDQDDKKIRQQQRWYAKFAPTDHRFDNADEAAPNSLYASLSALPDLPLCNPIMCV